MAREGKKPVNARRSPSHTVPTTRYPSRRAANPKIGDGMTDLPLAEAARYLGLSVAQTRRKVNAGELPSHRDARGRIIVELSSANAPRTPAPDPTVRELVQLRVEVGLLREERATFTERTADIRRLTDELLAHVTELTRQLALKDELIAELARRLGS